MKLIIDNRTGVYNQDDVIFNADEHKSLTSFYKLNGVQHTLLSLERPDGWQLMIGGGPDLFVIVLQWQTQNFTLKNQKGNPSITVELCAGGQFGDFPESICTTPDQAKKVISLFFANQEKQEIWI
jgi:hypothetical protein